MGAWGGGHLYKIDMHHTFICIPVCVDRQLNLCLSVSRRRILDSTLEAGRARDPTFGLGKKLDDEIDRHVAFGASQTVRTAHGVLWCSVRCMTRGNMSGITVPRPR